MILAATVNRSRTCELCGKTYVVSSLARQCEERHLEDEDYE